MIETFGYMPDGTEVARITLQAGELTAHFLSYGAILQDLRLNEHPHSLVLGLNSLEDYQAHSPYFGAIVGRCANRIADGTFSMDGKPYQLDQNERGCHTLHGGSDGLSNQVWRIADVSLDQLTLECELADGHMGFPGAMTIRCRYHLLQNATLAIDLEATCDAPSLCNLAHHSYFNLDGRPTIDQHHLQVHAEHYTPIDKALIPTGEITQVDSTPFDFRSGKAAMMPDQLLDHNFCLSETRRECSHVATLSSKASGISLDVFSTEPGLQVYDGSAINVAATGIDDRTYGPHAGLALEPQIWPDAPNKPHFPSSRLDPNTTYRQQTKFRFRK